MEAAAAAVAVHAVHDGVKTLEKDVAEDYQRPTMASIKIRLQLVFYVWKVFSFF